MIGSAGVKNGLGWADDSRGTFYRHQSWNKFLGTGL